MQGVVAVRDVLRTVSQWHDQAPVEQHSYAEDPSRVSETLSIVRDHNSKLLQARPQALIGATPVPPVLPDARMQSLVSDEAVKDALHDVASKHHLDIRKDAVEAMRNGVAQHVIAAFTATHFAASCRWKAETGKRFSWERPSNGMEQRCKGLAALVDCAEQWCGGGAAPALQRIAMLDSSCFAEDVAAEEGGGGGGAAAPKGGAALQAGEAHRGAEGGGAEDAGGSLPCDPKHLSEFLEYQFRAAAWRAKVAEEVFLDTCSGDPERFGATEDMARGAKEIMMSLTEETRLSEDKQHPVWNYIYATPQLQAHADAERAENAEAERLRAERKWKADEMEQSRKRRLRDSTTAQALGVKRGLILNRVRMMTPGDVERAALLLQS